MSRDTAAFTAVFGTRGAVGRRRRAEGSTPSPPRVQHVGIETSESGCLARGRCLPRPRPHLRPSVPAEGLYIGFFHIIIIPQVIRLAHVARHGKDF